MIFLKKRFFGYFLVLLVFLKKYVSRVCRDDGHETSAQSLAGMPDITRSPDLTIPLVFLRLRFGYIVFFSWPAKLELPGRSQPGLRGAPQVAPT